MKTNFCHLTRKIDKTQIKIDGKLDTYLTRSNSASLSTSKIFFLAAALETAPVASLLPIPAAVAEVNGILRTSSRRGWSESELEEFESELECLRSRL